MRITHVVMLISALVCATVAALLARAWLVRQSATPTVEAAAPAPKKSIVVAAHELKYGDKLDDKAVKLVPWASDTLPKGAFLSTDALLGGGPSRVVLSTIGENEPILPHKLLGGTSSNALATRLSANMKAVTIRVNEVTSVAGFVQPDDRVDVYLTYGNKTGPETPRQGASAVVVLLQNVRVLAVDQITQRKDQPTPAKAVTLEVTTEDAQKLVLAGRAGDLSLVLNRVAATDIPEATNAVQFNDLIGSEKQDQNRKPANFSGPEVTVTRGTERKGYYVPSDKRRDESWQHQILSHQEEGNIRRSVPTQEAEKPNFGWQ